MLNFQKWDIDNQLLATECISSISRITAISVSAREIFVKNNYYDMFMSSVANLGVPSRSLLCQFLKMIRGDVNDKTICNTHILIRLIMWITDMDELDQPWIAEEINKICTASLLRQVSHSLDSTVLFYSVKYNY